MINMDFVSEGHILCPLKKPKEARTIDE